MRDVFISRGNRFGWIVFFVLFFYFFVFLFVFCFFVCIVGDELLFGGVYECFRFFSVFVFRNCNGINFFVYWFVVRVLLKIVVVFEICVGIFVVFCFGYGIFEFFVDEIFCIFFFMVIGLLVFYDVSWFFIIINMGVLVFYIVFFVSGKF